MVIRDTTLIGTEAGCSTSLPNCYAATREATEALCAPLEPEDCVIQSMTCASPVKWHMAHTTWFFETFILCAGDGRYDVLQPEFRVLFNSYYNTIGAQFSRPHRGLLSRPTLSEVFAYRRHIDNAMHDRLENASPEELARIAPLLAVGLYHEQQHQELILTDIKHAFSCNPLEPVYRERENQRVTHAAGVDWVPFEAGVREVGHPGSEFAFDNEFPRHRVFLEPFVLASRLVTNREYLAFIEDGGYKKPELWLSDGWATVQSQAWRAPLYWQHDDGRWSVFTLAGRLPIDLDEPVCHTSYYEADAFARWSGARLATEAEWETSAASQAVDGNFLERGRLHPAPLDASVDRSDSRQMFGDVWEWTSSPYVAYPGYAPPVGALGEYNGKFMCNQFVLRGGSCATPRAHVRATYRNFFPPEARWQFAGIRLARSE